jgi:Domain of unknown function (DUF5615)
MTLRFQADVNLNQLMLRAICCREPALDFHTAEAADLGGLRDPEVLARAADEGRVLVTHNLQTMPRHFAELYHGPPSAGLLLVPQSLPSAAAVDDLLLIWSTMEAEEWINLMWYLPL